jgi:integrase
MAKWKRPAGKPYVALRGNTYYARLTVPKDLREQFGKTEIWKSLKTSDLREAQYRADRLVSDLKVRFAQSRGEIGLVQKALDWRRVLEEQDHKDERLLETFRKKHKREPRWANEVDGLMADSARYVIELQRMRQENSPEDVELFTDIVAGKRMTTLEFKEKYLESLRVIPRTLQQRETHLTYLSERFPYLPVKRSDVAKWILEMESDDLAEATIKGRIGSCRGYFDFLQRLEYLDPDGANPFDGHRYTKRKKASKQDKRQAFEASDIPRLIDTASSKGRKDPNLVAAINIAAYTGMRREEIARLRVEHVRVREEVRYFEIIDAKSNAGLRDVPIHSKLDSLVDQLVVNSTDGFLLSGESITKNDERGDAIGKRFKTLRDGLGFDGR